MADKPESDLQKWLDVVSSYDSEFEKWQKRVTKILKRYRDDSRNASSGNETAKFNILWANVQTLIPAVYAKLPTADVSRRFGDDDPVGRVASLLLSRALDYEIEHYPDFRSCMRHAVEDRFLGGRGIGWVRYDPHLKTQDVPEDGLELTDEVESEGAEDRTAADEEPPEEIAYECSPTDYVHWKDFGHSTARTWEEVTQVWRWVYMSAEALDERFGKGTSKKVPMDSSPEPLNRSRQKENKDLAKICELWDKESGNVYWFSKGYTEIIDQRPDPLELQGFFPCPHPLFATTTSDSLVPVPDFVLYQDQANELDILSDRIDGLVKSLRVRGVYDASQPALQRLLTEGDNNTLIPNDKWGAFQEKGGLKGSIELLPIDTLASALLQCYQAQANIKGQVYEITGISDIIRGESVASETATAQQIKGQYAGLRLKSMQETVALFASELLRLKAQIICTKYQPDTILDYAAADQMSEADKALVPQALQLLQDNPLEKFRIEIAADSLVQIDENQNKQDRLEFGNAFSNFLREAMPAGQAAPEIVPMLMAMIKYMVGGFKQARAIEGTIDVALTQLQAKAAQMAANPQPSPEMQKLQAQAQADQQAAQVQGQIDNAIEQIKSSALIQVENIRAQTEMQTQALEQQHEAAMKNSQTQLEQAFSKWEAELKASTAVQVALIAAGQNIGSPAIDATNAASENLAKALGDGLGQVIQHIDNSSADLAQRHSDSMKQIGSALQQATGPKRIIRGSDGRAVGVEPVQPSLPLVH